MEDSCPATPLVLAGRDSKSPLQIAISSPESDGMKSPSERVSPDSRCVICLGRLQNKSFTDSCLHQFCFQCLLQWSKVKPECPLCKQPFKSIIHNIRSNLDYDQYHVEHGEPRFVFSDLVHSYIDLIPVNRRFRYRSTLTHEYFRELAESFYSQNIRNSDNSYVLPPLVPVDPPPAHSVRRSNRLHANSMQQRARQRGTSDFRRNIYAQDLWALDFPDVSGRYRECTPQFYRENPAQIFRIIPWLNREINVLLGDCSSHASYVLDRIVSILRQHCIRSREFRQLVQPYFGNRTEHFIHELYTFAHSVYDMAGFDQNAVYGMNPNYATEVQEISSSNEDSDIEVIESVKDEKKKKRKRPPLREFKEILSKRGEARSSLEEPVAGPSGINSAAPIDICESDSDDIKLLDYVKPEPEVVTLSSGEEKPVFSDLDVSNGEYAEVIHSDVETFSQNRSPSDKEYLLPSEKRKTKYRSGKGKCKSNGDGLKGKQKRKYIKSRKCRSASTTSLSSSSSNSKMKYKKSRKSKCSSTTSLSSSSSSSDSSSSRSTSSRTKSKRSRSESESSSGGYKSSKLKKKKSKVSRMKSVRKISCKLPNKISEIKRHRSANGLEVDTSKTKKKVKSCVIVPKNSSPPYTKSKSVFNNSFSRESDDNEDIKRPRLLAPYWSMVFEAGESEKSRKQREISVERKSVKTKRRYSKSSSDETSSKQIRDSSSSSECSSNNEEARSSKCSSEVSRTSKKLKSETENGSSPPGNSSSENATYGSASTSDMASSSSISSSSSASSTSNSYSTVKLSSTNSYANSD